jgi:hypothetical protein
VPYALEPFELLELFLFEIESSNTLIDSLLVLSKQAIKPGG